MFFLSTFRSSSRLYIMSREIPIVWENVIFFNPPQYPFPTLLANINQSIISKLFSRPGCNLRFRFFEFPLYKHHRSRCQNVCCYPTIRPRLIWPTLIVFNPLLRNNLEYCSVIWFPFCNCVRFTLELFLEIKLPSSVLSISLACKNVKSYLTCVAFSR